MPTCPNCGKKDTWVSGRIIAGSIGIGGYKFTFTPDDKILYKISPNVYSYACSNCGYIESYVDPEDLGKKLKK